MNYKQAFICLILAVSPIVAQEQDGAKYKIGWRTGITYPMYADVYNNISVGNNYTLFTEWKLGDSNNAISANLEWVRFLGVDWGYGIKTGANAIWAGADYVIRPQSFENGFFVFAGLGFVSATETAYINYLTLSANAIGTCFSAGLGYDWTMLGVEVRYISASLNFNAFGTTENFSSIQVSARVILSRSSYGK